jgi:glycosyltransferase involved in cell wall biosynthesis
VRVIIDYRPALRARTGVGEYVFELARALRWRESVLNESDSSGPGRDGARDRLDLTLFSSSWKDRPAPADVRALSTGERGEQAPGVRFVNRRIPVRVLNLLWHRAEWPPIEVLTGRQFDVAFSPHPLLLPARHAAQVVTIYDLDFLRNAAGLAREIRRDYAALVRAHAHRAAHIVVSSHYTARQVESELGVSADRMTVCYPGAPDRAARPSPPQKRHVLFLGTLGRRKNVAGLLAAYGDLVSRRSDLPPLVLAGAATPDAAEWLARTERPPLAGRVSYLGYVSDEQRQALLRDAALFVLPSYDEGFGIPVVEAMAAGVPVVVSNRGALPEVVGDAGVIVEPEDQEALSGAMERLLTDDGLWAAASARGVTRARHFRWADTAASVVKAFERALGR